MVAPKGIVSTGWPAVERKCADVGIRFRWWQKPIGRLILAKRADGKYAATVGGAGLSIPRQVGKTFLVGAIVFALCLLRPNLTVIWTAHRVRTAEETFGKMQKFAKRPKIAAGVLKIVLGSGEEAVLFRNGSRILFGAREGGFGLGFDEVDVLIFDEAQRLTDATLDDMVPATNQSRQDTSALLLFMGTPPRPSDRGEVFTRMRSEALTGEDTDTAWIEFGADPDHEFTEAPAPLTEADWAQIAKANPSFPDDTPREAILRMRKKLGPESFSREGAGKWDSEDAKSLISRPVWRGLKLAVPPADGRVSYGVKFAVDGSSVALAAALRPVDGPVHVELVDHRSMAAGTGWLLEWLVERHAMAAQIVVDGKSGAGALVNALRERRVPARVIIAPGADQVIAAHAMLLEAVKGKAVSHFDQPALNESVASADKRPIGRAGGWGWTSINGGDVTPIDAATLAFWAAMTSKRRPGRVQKML